MPSPLFSQLASRPNLLEAWAGVRRSGKAPGLDGVTLPEFESRLDWEMEALRRELVSGGYHPWPARGLDIPKPSGSRHIGVQVVRDRLAQRAMLNLLQPRVEPRLEDCSYAFRPRRSVEMALVRLEGWRQQGFEWVARADVKLCFDSLDHDRLEQELERVLPEKDVRRLVPLWLQAGSVDGSGWHEKGVGAPQGDVLSPLLCNLYLDPFDEAVTRSGHPLVRYADDFVIVGRSKEEVQRGLEKAGVALENLGLQLNLQKSWIGTFMQGFEYLGAGIVGSLRLPLNRIERPGRLPHFGFGYGSPQSVRGKTRSICGSGAGREGAIQISSGVLDIGPPIHEKSVDFPLAATERALQDRMVSLLRADQRGQELPSLAATLLEAWQDAGRFSRKGFDREPEGWQSAYLI